MSDDLWPVERDPIAVAWEGARQDALTVAPEAYIDPIARLLDPDFTATLWEYEASRTEEMVPGQLHGKQVEILHSPARHRFAFWGNQVGKSTIGAIDVVLTALGRHPVDRWAPPTTQWASALTWELWENILLPELLTWIPADRLIDAPEPYKHSTKRHILVRADNGKLSRITGKASEQGASKYQSARIHKAWLDEEHPEAVWNEMQPRLLRHGGRTINTMTPLKGLTWVFHRYYTPWREGRSDPSSVFVSHAGLKDNPSITDEALAALREEFRHSPNQLASREEGLFVRPEGLALKYDAEVHPVTLSDDEARALVAMGRAFGGIDFGDWRFAFTLWAVDREGVVHLIDELYSQREESEVRAKAIEAMRAKYGCLDTLRVWGDAANPSDIRELNANFRRIDSKLVVVAVDMDNKDRVTSVTRINDLLGRGALRFRRGTMAGRVWRLGWSAGSSGVPVEGSRLLWEIDNWKYPEPGADKAQKQDPEDNTADGADAIASMRYAIMSWWKAAKPEPPPKVTLRNKDTTGKLEMIFDHAAKQKSAEVKRAERIWKQLRKR